MQCYRGHYVIKVLILDPDKGAFHAYAYIINTHSICMKENDLNNGYNRECYKRRLFIGTPALEASAFTVLMVWLRTCSKSVSCTSTVMISPEPLSPSLSISSAMNAPETQKTTLMTLN